MLHLNTELIITKPMLIISGANGSGKTQIIEALMILFGEKSPRSRQGIQTLINDPDRDSIIEIEVNNKKSDGTSIFESHDPHIQSILENDTILFKAKLMQNKVKRYIGNPKKSFYQEITLRSIQKLFSTIGIRPQNQLTFTLGETVDVFANQSNSKKFQVLLENLGLAELKSAIVENEKGINEAVADTAKLQRKLKEEEENLEFFRSMIDAIEHREKLESQVESLLIEKNWIEVFEIEDKLENKKKEFQSLFKKHKDKKEKITDIENKLIAIDHERNLITDLYTKIRNERINLELKLRENQKESDSQVGVINILNEQIVELQNEKQDIEEKIKDKKKYKVELKTKIQLTTSKLSELKDLFSSKTDERHKLDEKNERLNFEIPKYESKLQQESLLFRNEVIAKNLSHQILGPFISYIRLDDYHKNNSWLPAIKRSIGSYLYSFIALDNSSFKESKQIFDSLWPEHKPGFEVFRFSNVEVKRSFNSNNIYAFVPDLLIGDPRIILTLKRIMTTAISEDSDPNILLDTAVNQNVDILTKSCKSFYRRRGSFSRPPRLFNGELGKEIKADISIKDINRERKAIDTELHSIKLEETKLIKSLSDLRNQELIIDSPAKELSTLSTRLMRYEERLEESKKSFNRLKDEINLITNQLEKKKIEESNIKINLDKLKEEVLEHNVILKKFNEEFKSLDDEYKEANLALQDIQNQIKEKLEMVVKLGPKPEERRSMKSVDLDLKEIQTKLALVKDKSIPKERLELQEKKVVELRENTIERRNHLEQLRKDIQDRMDAWKAQIEPFMINLTETLQDLTKNIFSDVKLQIDSEDLEKAGLELKAVTKGDFRSNQSLSGGEKVMLMESLILALHVMTVSPLHIIDEFTQRLDVKNKTKIYRIVKQLLQNRDDTQFILITPDTLGIEVSNDIQHVVVSQAKVVTN